MTGPDHYREAEAKLQAAYRIARADSGHSDEDAFALVGVALQRAQVHATLALAAAAAIQALHSGSQFRAWREVLGDIEVPGA